MKQTSDGALPPTLHPEQRLTYLQVQSLTGWGRSKLAERVKAGAFPQPERDGRRCTRWRAGDVLDYLAQRRARLTAAEAA
jgi:prophage regulatory protein